MPASRQKETSDELQQDEPVNVRRENTDKSEQNDDNEGWKHDEFTTKLVWDVADDNDNNNKSLLYNEDYNLKNYIMDYYTRWIS